MNQIKSFSDFNLQAKARFNGKKIPIEELVGNLITVKGYKIEPSIRYKEKGNGMMLTLQIEYNETERILFTGSVILQEQCLDVEKIGGFPFTATIMALKPRGFKFI